MLPQLILYVLFLYLPLPESIHMAVSPLDLRNDAEWQIGGVTFVLKRPS